MNSLFRDSVSLIWFVLMALTITSWFLGTHQAGDAQSAHYTATISIFVMAFFKVRLVILHFMEVKSAPIPLRVFCEAWLVVICTALIVLFLSGPSSLPV